MEYYLLQKTSKPNPLKINLNEEEVIIGRKSFAALQCSLHVSRKHASFQVTSNGMWFVKDLNSTNGVYVNGERIGKGLHHLHVDDVIGFGVQDGCNNEEEFEFTFCSELKDVKTESLSYAIDTSPEVVPLVVNDCSNVSIKQVVESTSMCVTNISAKTNSTGCCINKESCYPVSVKPNSNTTALCGLSQKCPAVDVECIDVDDIPLSERKKCTDEPEQPVNYRQKYSYILNGMQPKVVLKRYRYADKLYYQQNRVTNIRDIDISSDSSSEDIVAKRRKVIHIESSSSSPPESELISIPKCEASKQISTDNEVNDSCLKKLQLQNKFQLSTNLPNDGLENLSNYSKPSEIAILPKAELANKQVKSCRSVENLESAELVDMRSAGRATASSFNKAFIQNNNPLIDEKLENESSSGFQKTSNFPIKREQCSNSFHVSAKTLKSENFSFNNVIEVQNYTPILDQKNGSNNEHMLTAEQLNSNLSVSRVDHFSSKDSSVNIKSGEEHINAVVKTEPNHVDDDECFNYSQHDEVIVISDDDDDYFNIPLSQIKHEYDVNIKVEPCGDIEELDHDFFHKDSMFELENECPVNSNEHSTLQTASENNIDKKVDAIEFEESENIDNIQKFLNCIKKSDNSIITHTDHPDYKTKESCDSYFPVLSQAFYTSDEGSSDENELHSNVSTSKISTGTSHEEHSKPTFATNEKFSAGQELCEPRVVTSTQKNKASKTLLTDPKPMQQRPRYQRGREEWFEDRYGDKRNFEKNNLSSKPQSKCETKREIAHHKTLKKESKNSSTMKPQKPKQDLRKKVKEQMGHRIRAPNGGSAIPMTSNTTRENKKVVRVFPTGNTMPASKKDVPKSGQECNIIQNQKSGTVRQRPERFNSRMEFLKDPVLPKRSNINSATNKKSVNDIIPSSTKNKAVFKIPKLRKNAVNKEGVVTSGPHYKTTLVNSSEKKNTNTSNSRDCGTALQSNSHEKQKVAKKFDVPVALVNTQSKMPIHFDSTASSLASLKSLPVENNQTCVTLPSAEFSKRGKPYSSHHSGQPQNLNKETQNVSHTLKLPTTLSNNVMLDPRLKRFRQVDYKTLSAHDVDYRSHNVVAVRPFPVQNNNLTCQSQVPLISKLSAKFDFESLIAEVLKSWNPSWLKEYERIGKPPRVVTNGLISVPLSFDSLDQYAKCFYSLIRVELWETMFLDFRDYSDRNVFFIMVTQCIAKGDLMVLECESLVSSKFIFQPKEGSLLTVDLRETNKKVVRVFAYVYNHKMIPIPSSLHKEWHRRPEIQSGDAVMYQFSMKTKKRPVSLDFQKLMKASVVSYIANKLRLADTFQFLISSSLTHYILQPSEKAFCVMPIQIRSPILVGDYNEKQMFAIVTMSEEMKKPYMQPKILLLQGPPGTGKTHTIVGIVQALLLDEKNKIKILIAAPSNAAVDEIGRRLIHLKTKISSSKLRMVRIGLQKQIHRDLLPYSLDELTKKNSRISCLKEMESLQRTLKEKNTIIENLQKEIDIMSAANVAVDKINKKIRELRMEGRRYQHVTEEMENTRKRLDCSDVNDYACKINLLKNADIILSTLSSCRLRILESVFGLDSDTHFTCCIVDEATQCTEPEVLHPLVFGLSKFILVGDHHQLPATVQSKLAADCHYERSLFERIHLYFQNSHVDSPVFMLTEQYRMHSEICSFPSSHFYSNRLVTNSKVNNLYRRFPFRPFTVLDIIYGQESNAHSSKTNVLEAESIIEICKQLIPVIPKTFSIGIITPYQAQRHLYLKEFYGRPDFRFIEVNTVDGFQGREKDVIILSCVRARSATGSIGFLACKKRLNVAITRARQCLIICGHVNSLKSNPIWTDLIRNARQRKCCISVTDIQDISFVLAEMKKL